MNITTTPGGGQEKSHGGGGRNCALVSEAGRLRRQGLEEPEIFERLMESPSRQGLPESEVRTIAKSVCRYPAGERRPGPGEPDPYAVLPPVEELARRRGWTVAALDAIGALAAPDGKREVHFPMRRASKKGAGEITGWRRRRADNGKFGEGEEAKKALTVRGGKNGLLIPDGFASIPESETVLVVEGEADLCAALSADWRAVVGTPGATPGRRPLEDLQHLLAGRRDVVLAPDPDPAGEKWRDELARLLKNAQCNVRYIPAGGGDLDKRLHLEPPERRAGALREMITGAVPWRESPAGATESTGSGSGKKPKSEAGESTASLATPPESAAAGVGEALPATEWDFAKWVLKSGLENQYITTSASQPEIYRYEKGFYLLDRATEQLWNDVLANADALRDTVNSLGDNATDAQRRFSQRLGEARTIEGVVKFIKNSVARNPSTLDAHPFFICSSDGMVYDLEKRDVRPLTPSDLITKAFGAKLDWDAKCPRWERFLEEIWLGDKALIAYFHRLVGYCMTGDVREQKFWVLWGEGHNGKSKLVETLAALFGAYHVKLPAEFFLAQQHPRDANAPSPILASLKGARLAIGSETGPGRKFNEPLLKELSGGDTLTARRLYGREFQFSPTHKLFLMTNNKPRVSPNDMAMWRRLRLIPFPAKFEGERDDKKLGKKLLEELPGILVWGFYGALEWFKGGLGEEPECVREAVEEYKREMDPVARFISETCETREDFEESTASLRRAYQYWAGDNGAPEMSDAWLGRRLNELGYGVQHTKLGNKRKGLRLLPEYLPDASSRGFSGYSGDEQ